MAALGSPLSFFIQKAQSQKSAQKEEWLNLIHYRKTLLGKTYSIVQGNEFFLSPEGKTSPEKELEATLKKFFDGSPQDKQKYQCQFLARRDFLIEELGIDKENLASCPEFDSWISKLGSQKVSLIFATGSLKEAASSFGHVFLKLKNPKNEGTTDLLNYGINYAARTKDVTGALYILYGLFGYFPGTYGMAPFHHLIKQYTNMEGRDLWEYELNLSKKEVDHLMKHMLELEHGFFDYYFLDDNCALMIAQALDVARPGLHVSRLKKPWSLPLETVKNVVKANIVTSKKYRASLQTEFDFSYQNLNLKDKLALRSVVSHQTNADLSTASSLVLDAAQNYFSLKGSTDFDKYKNINYKLSIERSKRSDPPTPPVPTPDMNTSPDYAAGSSMIGVGRLQEKTKVSSLIKVRAAGHDLLTSPIGVIPFTELEVFSAEIKTRSKSNFPIKKFTALNILSTRAVSLVEAPLSFGFAVKYEKNWQAPFKLGYSFDLLKQTRLMLFATGRAQDAIYGEEWFKPGYQTLLAIHFTEKLRGLISYEGFFTGHVKDNIFSGGLAWQLTKDLDVRFEKKKSSSFTLNFYF